MSEQEYVTVPCRVPKGLLEEGEELEIRQPTSTLEKVIHGDGTCGPAIYASFGVFRPIVVQSKRKRFEDWAERNLPKPLGCVVTEIMPFVWDKEIWLGKEEFPNPSEFRSVWFEWNPDIKRWTWKS